MLCNSCGAGGPVVRADDASIVALIDDPDDDVPLAEFASEHWNRRVEPSAPQWMGETPAMTIQEIFEKYNAPWSVFQMDIRDTQCYAYREGRIYGVHDKDGNRIAHYLSLPTSKAIAIVPEMLALIYELADGRNLTNYYQKTQAETLLKMIEQ